MARGRKTGGRDFKIGNPGAGRKKPFEAQEVRRLTALQVEEIASMLLMKDLTAIEAISNDPTASAIQRWFASCIIYGIKTSHMGILNAVLDRTIGKVKQHVEVSTAEPWIFESTDGTKTTMGMSRGGYLLPDKQETEKK